MTTCENLSAEDRALMTRWFQDYEAWNKDSSTRYNKYLYNEAAAKNLALLLVGFPLFLFHWRLVRKEHS